MFLPKIVNKILLKIFARPTTFLDTLNLFNEKDINKILNQHNVTATRIMSVSLKNGRSILLFK